MPGDEREQVLDRDTSLELLHSVYVGRVAWATDSGEAIVLPVNFVVDGDDVLFRTAAGAKLDAVRSGRIISFEADDLEPALHVGWSVLVTGPAEVEPAEQDRFSAAPLPWDREPKPFLVRLRGLRISGRRLPLHAGGVIIERQNDG
jgi:nitroimidazol reductase NimA-like FMN-containing flavoprotein (pyridoxamine 5'-phosphate oxidase superfamily)